MSYRVNPKWSLETLIDYLVAVCAALMAQDELQAVAEPFVTLKTKARTARDRRDDLRYAWIAARSVASVRDVALDHAVGDLSGVAYLASGKDDQAPPYSVLFGRVKAHEMKKLGLAKASHCGRELLAKLSELTHPALAAQEEPLKLATERLTQADALQDSAKQAMMLFSIEVSRLTDEVQRAVDGAEVAILTRFPGNKELVRALLSPYTAIPTREEPTEPEA